MTNQKIYQFKIILQKSPLPIWRRTQVPENYSFWDLHVAIQDAMGWFDYHLHSFDIINPMTGEQEFIGIPGEEFDDFDTLSGWDIKLRDYFNIRNNTAKYIYDFGDDWHHTVKFEGEFDKIAKQKYPICIAGKNACPPEDVGGVWGYKDFLNIINNPKHDEYKEMMEWVGGDFDPHKFIPEEVIFEDPKERRKLAFS